jgi:hypothetical protein
MHTHTLCRTNGCGKPPQRIFEVSWFAPPVMQEKRALEHDHSILVRFHVKRSLCSVKQCISSVSPCLEAQAMADVGVAVNGSNKKDASEQRGRYAAIPKTRQERSFV